MHGANMKIKS